MKKIICVFCVLLGILCTNVSAATLEDAVRKVTEILDIKAENDTSYADKLHNRLEIKDKKLANSAIKNKIVICKNNVLNFNGNDFSPLTNGLIYRYVREGYCSVLSGTFEDLERVKKVDFNDETFYITPNFSYSDITKSTIYTCIVGMDNKAKFVWADGKIKQPAIYRAKLYWADENLLVATDLEKRIFGNWFSEGHGGFVEFDATELNVDRNFVLENLDKPVYLFADNYGGKYTVYGIGKE